MRDYYVGEFTTETQRAQWLLIFLPVRRCQERKINRRRTQTEADVFARATLPGQKSSSLRDSGKENFILRIGIFGSYARREMVGGIEKTLHTVGTLLKILMYPGLFLELLEVA